MADIRPESPSVPEILAPINDGYVYAFDAKATLLWRYDYSRGKPLMYGSEVVVADLNGDGSPEIIFGTWGEQLGDGHLVILSSRGEKLYDIELPNQRENGNGIGAAVAPTVADLDGDGTLEILVLTIDHGLDVYHVPGSSDNCLVWPTGRANLLRNGQGPAAKQ
ncbi:MAG: VCBS repeat-containing protein [Deltaproteobacteria bacterium]|nr:VCBS repeat-containing protein [Deltaproteobacteria bacterium]